MARVTWVTRGGKPGDWAPVLFQPRPKFNHALAWGGPQYPSSCQFNLVMKLICIWDQSWIKKWYQKSSFSAAALVSKRFRWAPIMQWCRRFAKYDPNMLACMMVILIMMMSKSIWWALGSHDEVVGGQNVIQICFAPPHWWRRGEPGRRLERCLLIGNWVIFFNSIQYSTAAHRTELHIKLSHFQPEGFGSLWIIFDQPQSLFWTSSNPVLHPFKIVHTRLGQFTLFSRWQSCKNVPTVPTSRC